MKADRDDAPIYIRRQGWLQVAKIWTIPTLAGTCVTLGLLQLANLMFLNEKVRSLVDRPADQLVFSGSIIRPPIASAETGYEKFHDILSAPSAYTQKDERIELNQQSSLKTTPKQTTFNDRNYIPHGANNVVSMLPPQDKLTNEQLESKDQELRVTIVGEKDDVKESACWPLREGSIEKRNCKAGVGLYMRNRN